MNLKRLGAGLALMLMMGGTAAAFAAPRDDYYSRGRRDGRYRPDDRDRSDDRYRDSDRDRYRERDRRDLLHDRVHALIARVREADRRNRIPSRDADRLLKRLDRINDFSHRDRDLTTAEFRRRMADLDDVERDFYRLADRRHSYRGYCEICGGDCRAHR